MAPTDAAKAVIALTTRFGDAGRPSLSPSQWHRFSTALADAGLAPADVFAPGFDPAGVAPDLAQTVRDLLADAARATVTAADLENKGIWTLTIVDDDYPAALTERLGSRAPPVICGAGSIALLAERGIGIVGSRNVTEEGAAAATDIARLAGEAGHTVVSGGARGVDQLAMNAAFARGGRVLGILADSLQARIRKPDILHALDSGTTTLITQQSPASGFTPASAMGRNKLIYAMSRVTVVIASDAGSGGTWAGAIEAMQASNGVVAVWRGPGEGPGNAPLEERGAVPLRSAQELFGLIEAEPPPAPQQLSWMDSSAG